MIEHYLELAEKVDSTNYAAMSYNELVTINLVFLRALGEVKPLMKKKRAEEMAVHTHDYVAKMNNYGASKEEILANLEKEAMREYPYGPFPSQDVDEQTPSSCAEDNQDNDEKVLTLPGPGVSAVDDIDVNAYQDALAGGTTQEDEVDSESSSSEGEPLPNSSETNTLVEEALETMRALPAPKDVNVNAPYYVEAIFAYGDTEKPGYSNLKWRNMGRKDLEDFRDASEIYEKLFLKRDVLASTDEYLIINESLNSIRVRKYHFPELSYNDTPSNAEEVSDTERKEMKKEDSLLKKAIKKAKEISSTIGMPADAAFYDRFTLKKDGKELVLQGDPKRFFEDAEALPVIMSSFATYARLVNGTFHVLVKDNCVAATSYGETFYVVLFNIPVTKKERKARRKSEPGTESVAELERKDAETSSSSAQSVRDSILKAVEMTKSLPLGNGTDNNAPYFVQREFLITESGDVVPKARPFSKNVSGDDELAGHKRSHCRFAKAMKANATVSTDNYTAFTWNNGNNLTVFYYNTNTKAETAN